MFKIADSGSEVFFIQVEKIKYFVDYLVFMSSRNVRYFIITLT